MSDRLPPIYGYRGQLQLIFDALIDNAIKFSESASQPTITITYSFEAKGKGDGGMPGEEQFHCITIEDNAIGFDNEFADKIFMIFQRLHSQHSKYGGRGIGLAIAQRVMVSHNGFITALGNPGSGAKFHLHFPVQIQLRASRVFAP